MKERERNGIEIKTKKKRNRKRIRTFQLFPIGLQKGSLSLLCHSHWTALSVKPGAVLHVFIPGYSVATR